MPLHLFIEGAARQLQFFEHRFHIAFVPRQGGAQALGFEGFLLSGEGLAGLALQGLWLIEPQHLALGDIGQFTDVTRPVVAEQMAQLRAAQGRSGAAQAFGRTVGEVFEQQGNVLAPFSQRRQAQLGDCLLYTSPSPRDATLSRMPSSA